MILVENTQTYGWEAAIRGMRNPLESWGESDSYESYTCDRSCKDCPHFEWDLELAGEAGKCCRGLEGSFVAGAADLDLMTKLADAGPDHDMFLRMITVTADITAPLYWWEEFDAHKAGTVAHPCSTMRKMHAKEFTLEDFSHENLDVSSHVLLVEIIDVLNRYRNLYNNGFKGVPGDDVMNRPPHDKTFWWQMVKLLPHSYNLKRTIMLDYGVLRNMYKEQSAYELEEWWGFCRWAEGLPYARDLILHNGKCAYGVLHPAGPCV